jgi:hypothetical protein
MRQAAGDHDAMWMGISDRLRSRHSRNSFRDGSVTQRGTGGLPGALIPEWVMVVLFACASVWNLSV